MSIETWKAEFMPLSAKHPKALAKPVQHSLQKWRGLTRENLKKHGLKKHGLRKVEDNIYADDDLVLEVYSSSCALCEVHLFEVRFPDGPVDGDGLPTYLQGTAWRDAKVEDLPTLPGLAQEA